MPLYGAWVWFTRHSDQLVVATLNPPATTPVVETLPCDPRTSKAHQIALSPQGDVLRMMAGAPGRGAEISFDPAFPNLETIQEGKRAEGRWTLSISGSNITGGTYSALRDGESVGVELTPTIPWRPGRLP